MKLFYSNTLLPNVVPLRDVQHGQSFRLFKETCEGTKLPMKIYKKWFTWIVIESDFIGYRDDPNGYDRGWFTSNEYQKHQNDLVELVSV